MKFLNLKALIYSTVFVATTTIVVDKVFNKENKSIVESSKKSKLSYQFNRGGLLKKRKPSSTVSEINDTDLDNQRDSKLDEQESLNQAKNKKKTKLSLSKKKGLQKPSSPSLTFSPGERMPTSYIDEEGKSLDQNKKDNKEIVYGIGGVSNTTKLETTKSKSTSKSDASSSRAFAPKIKGKIPALSGLISYQTQLIDSAYAAATSCTTAKIQLFDTNTMTVLSDNPIGLEDIEKETTFEFDPVVLNLELKTPTRYLLKTSGCDQVYERIVTSFYSIQDLSPASTLLSKIFKTSIAVVPESINGEKLEKVITKIQDNITYNDEPEEAYTILNSDPEMQNMFHEVFNGEDHTKLKDSAPDVQAISIPDTLAEKTSSIFSVTTEHWDATYTTAYQWKLDGVTQSNAFNWSYTPSANEKRNLNITLLVGKKLPDPSNDVDTSLPHHVFDYTISVTDDFPVTTPNFSFNASVVDPSSTRDISVDIDTGASQINCESFTNLAITENSNVPSSSDFTINCSTPISQTIPYHIYAGDGVVTLNLWARDVNGEVSAKKSISLLLDTAGPVFNISAPSAFYRADTNGTFSWTVTDANLDSANNLSVELYDGSSWTNLVNKTVSDGVNVNTPYSQTYLLPNVVTADSRIRLSLTDKAGNNTTSESPLFEIRKPNLAVTPTTYDWGSTPNNTDGTVYNFVISNSGNAATKNCLAPVLSGTNASEFEITTDGCSTNSLAAGSNCTVTLRPKPTAKGIKNSTLTWTCDLDTVSTTLSYTSANNLPLVGTNSTETTNEDTVLNFNVNPGTDLDSDPLTYSIVTAPTNGVLSGCLANNNDLSCTYTPNTNFYGSDSFTYKVNDGTSDSASVTTVSITVNSVNDRPVIGADQNFTTAEDTLVSFTLNSATDVDIPVQPLTYKVITAPTNGVLANCIGTSSYGSDITCDYTPNADFNGSDSFTYEAFDSLTNSISTATVSITTTAVNDAPTLVAGQSETTAEDTVLNFNLNAGADIDGDTLNYIIATTTTNGVLSCTGGTSRACTYTPNLNYNGSDSFTYKVNDGSLNSPTRTVNLTITPVNDQPTLVATQTVSTNEDTTLNFTLNAGADVDGDTLSYIKVSDPAAGTLSCSGGTSRNCTYTPVANDNGSYTFTYKVNDGALDSAIATVTINISAENDAPVMVGNQSLATNEDTNLALTLSGATDIDTPAGSLQYKLITAPANGTLSNCITTGSYSSDITCDYLPNANFNGTDSFTYRANDTITDSATDSTVTITVNAVNDAPTLAATQSVSTNEDTPLTFNLTAGSDIEGDSLNYIKITNTTNGTISCTGGTSRSCTYTPSANYNGSDSFTYKVNDGSLDSTTATVTITINPINDPPTVAADQTIAVTEDTAQNFTISAGADIDLPAQTIQYQLVTAPTNGILSGCIVNGSYTTDTTCTYTPNANFNGTDSIVYKAYDGIADSTTNATITFNISAVNDAPTLVSTQSVAVVEDTLKSFNLTAGADIESDPLTYIIVSNPSNGTLSCTGGTSRACNYTPALNFNGTDTFTYKVNDGALDSTTNTVTLTVSAVNDAPTLAATQTVSVVEDTAKVFDLTAGADVDGDTLNYVILTTPAAGTLSCTGGTSRNCTYTPAANDNGSYTFTYRVNDGALNSTTNTVTLNISAVNDAPVAVASQSVTTDEDVALNFNLSAGSDIDGDTLNYIVVTNPTNGSLSCTGGTSRACTYTPNTNFNGSDSFSYKVNDGTVDSGSNTVVSITVNSINDAPVMAANQTFTTDDNVALSITLSNATDVDGDSLSYKIVSAPANGVLSNCITTGSYGTDLTCTYNANSNFNGTDTFTFIANDGTVDAGSVETVTITVNDKTPPSAPAVILAHSIYRKVMGQNLTATSCTDTPFILINEGTQPTAGDAAWQACTTTAAALSYTLASATEGNHTLKVWAKDTYSNISTASTNLSVIYDITSPVLAVNNPGVQKGGQVVSINWDLTELNIDSTKYYTIDYWNGSAWTNISTTKPATSGPHASANFSTNWSVPSLNRTDIKLRVAITDLAGNTASAESTTFEIDSIAPSVAITSPTANSYHQSALTLAGTCETGISVAISGDIPANFSTACSSGTFSQLVNLSSGDGNKTITVTQTDPAGNATSVSRVFTRDEVAPAIAKTTGISPDFTKNNQPNAWGGTCEGNYTISVTGDETTSFACSSGSWSWTPSAKTTDGTYTYNLTQTDGAGNTSTPLSLSWERDATAPVFTASTPTSIAVGQTVAYTTNSDSITASGTCEGTNTINISGSQTAAISCSASSWTWSTSNFTTDAMRSFTFTQSDSAGNTSAFTLEWTRDTSGPALAIDSNLIKNNDNTVTFTGSCEIGLSIDISGTETTSTTCPSGTWSWTSASQTTDATRSYTFTQTATVTPFNSTAVTGQWLRETGTPTISAFSTTAPNPTVSSFIATSVTATSQNSQVNLSHFCIKSIDSTAPTSTDDCWVAINSPSVGLPLAQTLNLTDYSYLLGWVPRNYDVFVWVMDEAENISSNSAVIGTDKLNITFTPAVAPTISDVIAANTDLSTIPPAVSHSQVPAGSDVYIRWKVTDNDPLPSTAISIYYTEDEINFTTVSGATGLAPYHNNCPSITLDTNEGCYKWTGGSPYNTSYKIRVKVTDSGEMSSQSISNPLNSSQIKILAGNTESGLGGSAQTALFYTRREGSESDPGTLVVTNDGNVYVADYKRGILTIDPTDGKQKIFIPQTGTSTGDGGAATSATLNYVIKMALDFQGRLLILDRNRIRRVDLNMANPTIETIIGGGSDTGDTVANPLNVSIYNHSSNSWTARSVVFFSMPNGDIYFQSDYGYKHFNTATLRVRKYSAATGQVTSHYLTGTGDTYDATVDLASCQLQNIGIGYNPSNSQLTHVEAIVKHHSSYPACDRTDGNDGERYTRTAFDPSSFTSIPASTADSYRYYRYFHLTGMDGNMYVVIDRNYINRVNEDGTFTRVLASGTRGSCADGTANTSCNMDIQDMFITSSGKIYFLEGGQVRTIDDSGNVVTLFGQRRSYGDGVNALNARFDYINTAIKLNDEKIIVGDSRGYYLKEFTIAGNINTIAGNGNYRSYVDNNIDAKTQGFYDGSWFVANRATGEVYTRDYAYGRYIKLNRSTSKWDRVIGFGSNNYWDADGMAGMDVRNNGNQSYGLPIGFDGTNLLIARMKYNSPDAHWEDFMWKLYDSSDSYRQSHIAGVNDANTYAGGYEGIGTSGSVAATSKIVYYSYAGMPTWDAAGGRWVFFRNIYGSTTNGREIWSAVQGGNLTKLATIPRNIDQSYLYRKESGTDYMYYCAGGRIYKHNITTNTDLGQLTWPINNLYCRGLTIDYSAARNSLIFPFEQNGLFGVAEYYLP